MRLEYYQELEQATRMLNYPGDALVLQADFLLMVERVDVCIEWFQDHVRVLHDSAVNLLRLIPRQPAPIHGSRNILAAFPALHDACNDTHQNVRGWRGQSPNR